MEEQLKQNFADSSLPAYSTICASDVRLVAQIAVPALLLSIPAIHAGLGVVASGPLTRHMSSHIVLMNVLAPIAAYLFTFRRNLARLSSLSSLVAATIVQIALLWAWHAPPLVSASSGSHFVGLLSGVSLTLAATWFWASIFCVRGQKIWQAIAALLFTAKFFCLLGALLVFAPRALFECSGVACTQTGLLAISDQQFAGLLMIIACPLTYVTAGVIAAARWLSALSRRTQDGLVPLEPLPGESVRATA